MALNPQGLVPALQHESRVLIQSPAIVEWLEERYPQPPLLPADAPTLADAYLTPQVESARRFKVDLAPYPLIRAVDEACHQLDAFRRAATSVQPDAA